MIVSGEPVKSELLAQQPARSSSTRSIEGDLLDAARRACAREVADERPLPQVRDRKVEHPNADAFFQFARNTVERDGEELPGAAASASTRSPRR